jgi:hypothetical protein
MIECCWNLSSLAMYLSGVSSGSWSSKNYVGHFRARQREKPEAFETKNTKDEHSSSFSTAMLNVVPKASEVFPIASRCLNVKSICTTSLIDILLSLCSYWSLTNPAGLTLPKKSLRIVIWFTLPCIATFSLITCNVTISLLGLTRKVFFKSSWVRSRVEVLRR